jgi:endoglucanase
MTLPLPDPRAASVRRRCRALLALGTACLLAACGSMNTTSGAPEPRAAALAAYPPMPAGPAVPVSAAAKQRVQALGRGINFGNMLDAPAEGAWDLRVEDRFIDLAGEPGFVQSVRLPVRWSNHASPDAQAAIDPAFMARVDDIVRRLLAKGVTVVLNMHHYRQFDGDPLDKGEAAVDPAVVDLRFLAMWRQIAQHFAGFDPRLVLEIYNEPHGRLDTRWNDLLSRALRVIRESNPERTVVVGPVVWNSASALPRLVLPPDAHLVLTVHHYEPFDFTHQGAEWSTPPLKTGVHCCNRQQRELMTGLLDLAQREAARLGRPVFVGEFGAYDKAALPDRVAYLRFMRQEMEARGLPWMYWELAAGFGVYDRERGAFRSELKTALYGP